MNKRDLIQAKNRGKIVTFLTAYFALLYHITFLFIFLKLKVMPMFYVNIGSILVFGITCIFLPKINNYLIVYLIGCTEVLTHQILGNLMLGSQASFHFFILIMAILPYLILGGRFKLSFVLSIVPFVLFTVMEIMGGFFFPKYQINQVAAFAIKITNISLSITVIIIMVLIFAYVVHRSETNLENEVRIQSDKLQEQNEKLIKLQTNTIISLSNLVENRDADTGEHVRRTSAYVNLLANETRKRGYYGDILTDEYITRVVRAAPMHDIGKIVVSDLILKKPGKLTSEEFDEMKKHTLEGGRIIKEVLGNQEDKEYIKIASEIATYHHEKWNGSGYPYQKSEVNIPLSARIMAIADVFDALVSPRCYKEPFPVDKAFQIIQDSTGSHFDPILAKVFLESKEQISEIMEKYTE